MCRNSCKIRKNSHACFIPIYPPIWFGNGEFVNLIPGKFCNLEGNSALGGKCLQFCESERLLGFFWTEMQINKSKISHNREKVWWYSWEILYFSRPVNNNSLYQYRSYSMMKSSLLKRCQRNWAHVCCCLKAWVISILFIDVKSLCTLLSLFFDVNSIFNKMKYVKIIILWTIDQLVDLVDWSVDGLIDWSVGRLIGWSIDWLICWWIDMLIVWSVDRLIFVFWSVDRSIDSIDRFVVSIDRLVDLSFRLTDWSICRFDWSIDRLFEYCIYMYL